MAAATLNDVTNSLLMLNTEQGNTTEAVKSLVKRMQAMLDFDKRKALDDAEAAREAKNQARTQSQRTSAPSVSSPFGMGDALVAGALLTFAALNDQIRGVIDGVQDNLLSFVNDVQKIMFTLNQGLIRLQNFIDINIISRIRMLILDFRTNPKLTNISTVIEESLDVLKGIIDRTTKTITNTFKVIGNAFRFVGNVLRVPLAFITNGVSEAIFAVGKLNPVFKFFKGIGRIFSRLFLPLTIFITAWDKIIGAVDGFKEGGIIGGIEGAVTGFFNSLIFAPLDLLKEAAAWVLEQVGLTDIAKALKQFSFQETFEDLVGAVFGTLTGAVNWIKTVFTDPKEALKQLWQGLVGEGGLIDIIYAPLNAAVNFIRRIFNLGDPDQPFRMGAFIEGLITQTVDIFAQIFNKFMNMLRSIPVVKDFFKTEEEKAFEERKVRLQEEIQEQERFLRMLENDAKSVQTFIRSAGDPEVLGIRGLGKTPEQKEALRAAARQRLQAREDALVTLGSDRRLIEMARTQTAQRLGLAEQNLSAMQSTTSNTVVDNSTVAPNTTTVNNQMAVPTPAVETERFSLD